jgi:large subunit ribosomal protein L4|uniref:Large ribosomal subunit protein uL4c n=1 Tax=Cyanidiaceae sp. MX-AZ01 TaxID=1503164 RepID=A0A060A559_9RHOD|nr:ribosomal protein L4 [Cyanidiaceae sp. MX-AZ01]
MQNLTHILHRALRTHLLSLRQWGAHTKTRAEVRGGGRKPWKQKGTGRARAGSRRSPLWRGGGVTFGPRGVAMHLKINRKEAQKAVKVALMACSHKMHVVDPPLLERPSCQRIHQMLPPTQVLWIVHEKEKHFRLSCQNLSQLDVIQAQQLYVKPLLWAKQIWISSKAVPILEKQYQIQIL